MNRNFEDRKSRKPRIHSKENKAIIKALDMFDRVPEQWELLEEIERLQNIIKEVREYITSYESIDTIEGLEDIEKNKNFDEKTMIEMVRRYMIVHDKVLEILDKGE